MDCWPNTRKQFGSVVCEQFFNWQSDQDWTWGPFVFLRPPRDIPLRPWVWVRLFLIFTLIGLAIIGVIGLLGVATPILASAGHQRLPVWYTEAVTTLQAMLSDPGTVNELIGLVFSLPLLFFAFCLPYHWAWNKRAARLKQANSAVPEADISVWPPPPR